jgi:ApbE superfamily uncharacterized protein (UPF0280 family)
VAPQRAWLAGARLHLQHGPIDLVVHALGKESAVARAHEAAWARFQGVLDELVRELVPLRKPVSADGGCPLAGPIATKMWQACRPFHRLFITPMAAVAGAVADDLLSFYRVDGIQKAWVNNGGDIAFHLAEGQAMRFGVVPRIFDPRALSDPRRRLELHLQACCPSRGVATSGWAGRSFSLGIADSVTTWAASAAEADAAATVVANSVNIDHPAVVRQRAVELQPDSDLGDLLVTVEVPRLPLRDVQHALDRGERAAMGLVSSGRVHGAILVCQRQVRRIASAALQPAGGQKCLNPDNSRS